MRNLSEGNKVKLSYNRRTAEFSLENEDTAYDDVKVDGFVDFDHEKLKNQKGQSSYLVQ